MCTVTTGCGIRIWGGHGLIAFMTWAVPDILRERWREISGTICATRHDPPWGWLRITLAHRFSEEDEEPSQLKERRRSWGKRKEKDAAQKEKTKILYFFSRALSLSFFFLYPLFSWYKLGEECLASFVLVTGFHHFPIRTFIHINSFGST
jgi:hypothetical protein